jgi:hypothetical protein
MSGLILFAEGCFFGPPPGHGRYLNLDPVDPIAALGSTADGQAAFSLERQNPPP